VTANRTAKEGPLQEFITELHEAHLPRVHGTAVFPHPSDNTTPTALRANVEHNHVLHDNVVIISAISENVPHIPVAERLRINELGYADDHILHLSARFGFQDMPDLPGALRLCCAEHPMLGIDLDDASYFVSHISIRLTDAPGLARWRKRLFLTLARNASSPTEYFCLPKERTVIMGSQVDV